METSIAIDIGASSGRAIVGRLESGMITLEEICRFPNDIHFLNGHYRWKIDHIFREICTGLNRTVEKGLNIDSIGVDTWGVDYVLLDEDHRLIELPVAYRDSRTEDIMDRFFDLMPREVVYQKTGIQMMQINTLFQLYSASIYDPEILKKTRSFLMIPDYLNFRLSGKTATEYTIASTSQLLNLESLNWDDDLIGILSMDRAVFSKPTQPGTPLGAVDSEDPLLSGLKGVPVILSASHDTAAAVAAIPAIASKKWAYISSGTWSLMGIEVDRPVLTSKALAHNFTNEGGVDRTIRFLKNIMGLWPVQELQREHPGQYPIEEIVLMAEKVPPFVSLIDPDDPVFLAPGNMGERIKTYCGKTDQPLPDTLAQFARCAFDSLALQYLWTLAKLEDITEQKVECIHIVGGGSQNRLLNQLCADVTGCEVVAGPTEVTSLGNMLIQWLSRGKIASVKEGRKLIRNSFDIQTYQPQTVPEFGRTYERFLSLKANSI